MGDFYHELFPSINFILIAIVLWSIWRERALRLPYTKLFDEIIDLKERIVVMEIKSIATTPSMPDDHK